MLGKKRKRWPGRETGTSQTGTEGNGQQEQTEGNEKKEAGCAP